MKCPDCGSHLSDIAVDGLFLFRCYKCGGFWGDAHTFASIDPHSLVSMRRVKIDPVWLKGGTGICPQDGLPLQPYFGDDVSDQIHVRACIRCGKRWYAGDGLFEQKLAAGATQTRSATVPRVLFLSVLALALVGSVAGSVLLVSQRQQTVAKASANISRFTATYLKTGQMEVVFESDVATNMVEYRIIGSSVWMMTSVTPITNRAYTGLVNVEKGGQYEVRIHGQTFSFVAQ